ncbi:MAG: SDR family oxidoreductase [Chloroflexi bacterium]|nr:SDR family oxidoreductase [Chloroflexota bacterium]
MKVLVTGNTGYIGNVMVPLLEAAGHEVTGLDSGLFEECTFGERPAMRAHTLRMDVRDVEVEHLRGFDAVIHLAGISNDPIGELNPELTYAVNHRASVRLAEVAKAAGVSRYLFSSSCSVYGAQGDAPVGEDGRLEPITAYAKSKVYTERDVSPLADANFSPTYMRNATAYGASAGLRLDLVVNNLTAHGVTGGAIVLQSDGSAWRPLVHIEDISRTFLAVMEAPRELVHDQAFNVGGTEENYRIRDVAEIVATVVPNTAVEFAQGAEADSRTYRVGFEKIRSTLPDFEMRWTVRRGIEELCDAYRRVGLTAEDFAGSRYVRLRHITGLTETGRLDESLRWTAGVPA